MLTLRIKPAVAFSPLEITTDREQATIASFIRFDRRRNRAVTSAMFTVVVVIANRSAVPIYVRTAGREPAWRLQLRDGGTWRDAHIPVRPMCYTPPLVLRSGAMYRVCTSVHVDQQTLDAVRADGSCTARIVYDVFTQWNQGREGWVDEFEGELSADESASHPFTLATESVAPRIA